MREFDYTVVTSGTTRVLVDWALHRAFDISTWSDEMVNEFEVAKYARRSEMLASREIGGLRSWSDDVNPWDYF